MKKSMSLGLFGFIMSMVVSNVVMADDPAKDPAKNANYLEFMMQIERGRTDGKGVDAGDLLMQRFGPNYKYPKLSDEAGFRAGAEMQMKGGGGWGFENNDALKGILKTAAAHAGNCTDESVEQQLEMIVEILKNTKIELGQLTEEDISSLELTDDEMSCLNVLKTLVK